MCSLQPSSRKLLIQQMETITEKPQLNKGLWKPVQWIDLENTFEPKAQETVEKRGHKDSNSQNIRKFTVRWCLLVTSEATPIMSHQHDCPNVSYTRMIPKNTLDWTEKSL